MKSTGYFLYLLLLGIWTGGIFMFTVVVTPVIFKAFERDLAGSIVGRLFPGYFFFILITVALAATFLFFAWSARTEAAFKVSVILVVIALAIALYVNFSLYPRMQSLKKEIPSFESASSFHPFRLKFRKLHAESAVLNLILFADGVALVALAAFSRK